MNDCKLIYARDRKEWRAWLEKNHLTEKKVGLIKYKKHTGKPSLTHKESMDEAICFGWIDTTIKRLDEDRYLRYFAKRSKNSRWSTATQSYARALIKQKLMTPEGLKYYKEGLKKPTIDEGISKNPDVPEDLKQALVAHPEAQTNFASFAPSYRRTFLRWLEKAKLPETRKRRIAVIVHRARTNKKQFL